MKSFIQNHKHLLLFSLLMLFTASTAIAQSSKLDEKNGFNKFKLGDTYSSINQNTKLKQVSNTVTNSESYIVTDIENYSITGHPLQNIVLTFYKKKLFRISVMMPEVNAHPNSSDTENARQVRKKLIEEYGKWTQLELDEYDKSNNIVAKNLVSGNLVSLLIAQYGLTWIDDKPYAKGDIFTFIHSEIYKVMEKDLASDSGF